jgi:hypothetical protein
VGDPRELPGVTIVRPGVAGVLQKGVQQIKVKAILVLHSRFKA